MVKEFNRNIEFSTTQKDGRRLEFEIELSDWMKTIMADMGDEIESPITGDIIHNGEYYDLWSILTEHFETLSSTIGLEREIVNLKERHGILESKLKSWNQSPFEERIQTTGLFDEIAWLEVKIYEKEKELAEKKEVKE